MSLYSFDAKEVPAIRIAKSIGAGSSKRLLFVVGGGLGDRICAEPTIRYAIETFKDCEVSLCCSTPELFQHLNIKKVFVDAKEVPDGQYLPLYTYAMGLANQFINANLTHGVDFASISALRRQLPRSYRQPQLRVWPTRNDIKSVVGPSFCLLHVGKSWTSRTFPATWWAEMLTTVNRSGRTAVLVGKDCIDVPNIGNIALDYREKTSLSDFLWMCQSCDAVITNDSSPVHIAATGRAKIAMIATCRSPQFLFHWRQEGFGWRTKDFSLHQMWDLYSTTPNDLGDQSIAEVPSGRTIEEFLPNPKEIVEWIERG